ncbi:MAG TPA: pyridoxal phosphate-dependent aminotransferase [Acidimicrobiales bacterium]|nr:pyridoxal phosphate-dependent aminotransferase [Acidimicrobiales bacterium]
MAPAQRISSRIAAVSESATLAIDAKAKALRSAGQDVIGFGAGEPDFPTPAHIVEAAIAACRDPSNHHYTPAAGLPELREAVAVKTARDTSLSVKPAQVLVTNGGKQAVEEAFSTLLDPGDEVLMPAPYWTTYPESIRLAGGLPVEVPTTPESGYKTSVAQLEASLTPKTKVLLFVSPSNPTGAVYTEEEITAIGVWADERGLWVVTDEIYEHLVYGSARMCSMPVAVPSLAERCVVVNGVAKTYSMTGWRVGWLIGPLDVVKAAANLQSHTVSNVCNVAQRAALAALTGPMDEVHMMRNVYDRRRRAMVSALAELPGVVCPEPGGAFYAFPSFSGVLDKPLGASRQAPASTLELAELVLEEAKVAFVPGEAFGAPGCVRFSYALSDDDLAEGMRRLAKLFG